MPTVELSFSALPAHVRTARLVAAAMARRCGLDEGMLDEVRLAVGEACSRAVDLHMRHCPVEPVRVTLSADAGSFRIRVCDRAPAAEAPPDPLRLLTESGLLSESAGSADVGPDSLPGVGLAVISGLVDDLRVESDGEGTAVEMAWPAGDAIP